MDSVRLKKAVVLLSGGLDSTTVLYYALAHKFSCSCLIFDYGQRHARELKSARMIAKRAHCPVTLISIKLPWQGSSLLDQSKKLPRTTQTHAHATIPSTYVPARNLIFLSFAVSYAEAVKAHSIFIGANSLDYSGYPDCRPEFFKSFTQTVRVGTKAGAEGKRISIQTPLIGLSKKEIISLGMKLCVPYELTWSCYQGGKSPCGVCDSCHYRAKGFKEAGLIDPLMNEQACRGKKR